MSLTTHPYKFFSDYYEFWSEWEELLQSLIGCRVISILGIWDNLDGKWFNVGPMVLRLSSGELFVCVKSEKDLAIGWNEISTTEKPVWFDQGQLLEMQDLNWQEDLSWKEHDSVHEVQNSVIEKIETIGENHGLTGVSFFWIPEQFYLSMMLEM